MTDQLSAKDWLDQGLKTLAESGFTALKAEPLARAMGVSRGSFYWHFTDIGAFHAALLRHWREIATEQIIAGLGVDLISAGGAHDHVIAGGAVQRARVELAVVFAAHDSPLPIHVDSRALAIACRHARWRNRRHARGCVGW
jgi:AcrR family transcriptional regulator